MRLPADLPRLHRLPPPIIRRPDQAQPTPGHVRAADAQASGKPDNMPSPVPFRQFAQSFGAKFAKTAPVTRQSNMEWPTIELSPPVSCLVFGMGRVQRRLNAQMGGGRFTSRTPEIKRGKPLCSTIPTPIHHPFTTASQPLRIAFACTSPVLRTISVFPALALVLLSSIPFSPFSLLLNLLTN